MEYIVVGIGGALGSIARFGLGNYIASKSKTGLYIGTFLINISGSILLGLVLSIEPGKNILLLAADGFLGAYTTFSTFMYEGFNLFKNKRIINGALYIASSFVIGILGFITGTKIGTLF